MEHSVPAIVVAAFGAGQPEGLAGILAVLARVRAAWPALPVRLAFTSNRVRAKWRHRAADPVFRAAHPEVPEEVWGVRGVLATIADLQEAGHRDLVVQPLFIHAGEEFTDLAACVEGLAAIRAMKPRWRPFERLVLGRPALGQPGPRFPYQRDLARAAQALAADAANARRLGAALVYVGHGNPFFTGGVYQELEWFLRREYPGLTVVVGLVEGVWSPSGPWPASGRGATRALLSPCSGGRGARPGGPLRGGTLLVARPPRRGRPDRDLRPGGLGENPAWAGLYLTNLREAAAAAGLAL